jgi:hypothetical protein
MRLVSLAAALLLSACAQAEVCEEREYVCPGVQAYVAPPDGAVSSFDVRICRAGDCAYVRNGVHEPIACDVAAQFVERVEAFRATIEPAATAEPSSERDGYYRLTIAAPNGAVRKISRTGPLLEPEMRAILDALERRDLGAPATSRRE